MFFYEKSLMKIVQFQSILFLDKKKIRLQMVDFILEIIGENLMLTSYHQDETYIAGKIEEIHIQ